jgi:hypothetical protein
MVLRDFFEPLALSYTTMCHYPKTGVCREISFCCDILRLTANLILPAAMEKTHVKLAKK